MLTRRSSMFWLARSHADRMADEKGINLGLLHSEPPAGDSWAFGLGRNGLRPSRAPNPVGMGAQRRTELAPRHKQGRYHRAFGGHRERGYGAQGQRPSDSFRQGPEN